MQIRKTEKIEKFLNCMLLAGIIVLVLSVFVLAAVPPVDRDALTHHLAVPKLYLKHGGIVEIPWVPFSYFPMNLDLIYLIPLYFGNDILPKYIHLAFALLTVAIIFRYLKQRTQNSVFGLLGALLFLSLPIIVKLSTTAYVDLGLLYFSTASLIQLFRWATNGFTWGCLIWAGILCGLAMGTKYNGLITFFLLTCFIPILYMRRIVPNSRPAQGADGTIGLHEADGGSTAIKAIEFGVVFGAAAMVVFSPWMIRNYVWTRNPVYPLYENLFKPPEQEPDTNETHLQNSQSETARSSMSHFVMRRLVFKESLLETLTIPIRIFFQGEDDIPKYFDGKLNPYLLILPILSFIGIRRQPRRFHHENKILAAFSVLYLLFAFVQTDMRIRYVAPIVAPLVILSVLGVHNLILTIRSKAPTPALGICLVVFMVGLFMLPNLMYILNQFDKVEPLGYLSGKISRDEYIQRFRPEYASYQYINKHLPQEARVLGVFLGNRRYYCDRDLICDSTLQTGLRTSESADALSRIILAKGLTHIMLRSDLFEHSVVKQQSAVKRDVLQAFLNRYTHKLFSRDGYVLLELKK
jgi:4-amino-4-deoxy-L-arabinose transferase-like glycosyltransferase